MRETAGTVEQGEWRSAMGPWGNRLAIAALLLLCTLTSGRLLWEVEYFHSPGPMFYRVAVVGFAALGALGIAYAAVYPSVQRWRVPRLVTLAGALAAAGLFLVHAPLALAVAIAILLPVYAFGREFMGRLSLTTDSALETAVFSCGLGLGLLTLVLFALGLANGYRAWIFLLLLGVAAAIGRRHLLQLFPIVRRTWHLSMTGGPQAEPMPALASISAVAFLLCAVAVIIAPSIAFDPIRFHLPAARFYALSHSLTPVPLSEYSYYPQGMEVLMTMAYRLGGQAAAQLITPVMTVLFALALYRVLLRCRVSRPGALTGTVLAFSLPFVHWSGSVAKNDSALATYQALSLLCGLHWYRARTFRWILLGAFFLGCSFGIKHVALFGALPISLFYLYAAVVQTRWVRATLMLGAILILSGAGWQFRAYLLTGNPVFPSHSADAVTTNAALHHDTAAGTLTRYLGLPSRVLWNANTSFESPLLNPCGIALLVLAPLWLFLRGRSRNRMEQLCLVFCAMYLFYWCTVFTVLRYAMLPLCLLTAFSGARLFALSGSGGQGMRTAACSVFVYCQLFALCGTMIIELNAPQLKLMAGLIDRRAYLKEALLTYASVDALNGLIAPGDQVLGVDNCAAEYAPESARFDCIMGVDRVRNEAARHKLSGKQFRFLILKHGPDEAAVLDEMAGSAERPPVWTDPAFNVYRMK